MYRAAVTNDIGFQAVAVKNGFGTGPGRFLADTLQ
jgi:hypothetical protein